MIRAKEGFILQKMLDGYMIVSVDDSADAFRGIIRTNETGAFYWKLIEKGITTEALVRAAQERFEGLDELTARRDIKEFLESISLAVETA